MFVFQLAEVSKPKSLADKIHDGAIVNKTNAPKIIDEKEKLIKH